ncbi:MAG: metallophosphoesterase family protein [Opitutaceae bacterium]
MMRRIAVIADTHDRLPDFVVEALAAADEIWHLGDVCDPQTLDPLLVLGCPLTIVQGNCDSAWEWPLVRRLEREGRSFHLEHIPPKRAPEGADAVLHGHTHVPRDESVHGARFLNPGCITRPNRGAPASFAWLTIDARGALDWRIVRLAELA